MNSGLYFTVTLVALAWFSAGTCRANTNGTITNSLNVTMTTATTTAATGTTAAPPLVPNNTVSVLETPVDNSGCGTVQLCAAQPTGCNPGTGSCTLLGTKQKSGNNFEFILAGESSGYLATVLSFDGSLGAGNTAYVCFNQNGSIAFTGAKLNNDQLTKQNVSANNVRGRLTGTQIQCIFDATVESTAAKVSGVTLGVVSGTVSGGSFGPANTLIKTNPVNLANPRQNLSNVANTATTSSPNVTMTSKVTTMTTTNTTNNAMSFRQTLVQALMISAGVMGLTML